MSDLIDRQAAIDALGERPMVWMDSDYEIAQRNQYDMDKMAIETVPSAQPEIIRCKDCKWYLPNYTMSPFDTDGFDRWGGLANCQNENGLTECSDESYCSCGARMDDNG